MREAENWKICEKECFEYLKKNFSSEKFTFEADGGSDSTKSDILLKRNGIQCFFIESKMQQAQCGQFVVKQESNRFVNSENNRHQKNLIEDVIIDKMNENFDDYANPGTGGKNLNLDKSYFYEWIYNFYKSKDVKYFIVEKIVGENNSSPDNFIIFPIQHFHKYFDVTGIYRVKKSGSTHPSQTNVLEIETCLSDEKISHSRISFRNDKAYIKMPGKMEKFQLQGIKYDYQFNPKGNDIFEIRRLSNTKNANVIFSISLTKNQDAEDLRSFEAEFN